MFPGLRLKATEGRSPAINAETDAPSAAGAAASVLGDVEQGDRHERCVLPSSTTKIHTAMLMRALGVRNRTEAAFKAGKLLSAIEQSLDGPVWEPDQQNHIFD